jgi:hypothetical protein
MTLKKYVTFFFLTLSIVEIITIQRFRNWILLPSSGKKWGRCLRLAGADVRIAQPRGLTGSLSSAPHPHPPIFLPEDGNRTQLLKRKFIVL